MGGKRRYPPEWYKVRVMPKNLQIYKLKQLFLKANNELGDPSAEMDNIDFDLVDSIADYSENIWLLKQVYGQYKWEVQKPKKATTFKKLYKEYCQALVFKPCPGIFEAVKPLKWKRLRLHPRRQELCH
ncbi:MAG: hypothetical protein ABSB71_08460 [Candidatus Bathyarchaeia archaeon]|jgi:hypothetical protein